MGEKCQFWTSNKSYIINWSSIALSLIRYLPIHDSQCSAEEPSPTSIFLNVVQYINIDGKQLFFVGIIIRCDAIKFHSNMHWTSGKYQQNGVKAIEEKKTIFLPLFSQCASMCACVCVCVWCGSFEIHRRSFNLSEILFSSLSWKSKGNRYNENKSKFKRKKVAVVVVLGKVILTLFMHAFHLTWTFEIRLCTSSSSSSQGKNNPV